MECSRVFARYVYTCVAVHTKVHTCGILLITSFSDSVFVESHYYQARMYLECKEKTKNLPKRAESRPKLAATVKPTFKNSATLEPSLHTYSSETMYVGTYTCAGI